MAEPTGVPDPLRRLGIPRCFELQLQPQCPRPARGLSGERQQVRYLASDVQRGRRQHHPLDRTRAALSPVGLQGQESRQRGRRLADHLCGPRALLRSERTWMGCSGIAGDPANPPRATRPMPPLPLGPDGERIARGVDQLGWHWWPSDSYINSQQYRGRAACNNCGPNGLGCAEQAKGSDRRTTGPSRSPTAWSCARGARVFEITTGADGHATGAKYFDADGAVQFQPARAVIVAANGVGTPRLLLLSKSDRHPAASPIRAAWSVAT